ncbi:unnamed protein product [Polarella glacialis]|uniref:Non-specific serine/threonine protein kinase n=1 Tax=Polarella glacialis TaxID=89957 RepID=A0A813EYN2_POLGL|nr:unnamed protein product [Polarella glacialis]
MDPHILGMMRKEVQVLSALDHPNIVRLYEFAEDEARGELVLILEYVPGGDCIDWLAETDRTVSEKLVARVVRQVLVALNHCHTRGIVHRDVKPENMMLSASRDSPDCKLIDFGLASPYKGEMKEFAGTVSYLSPEQAVREAGYSTAADIWAVGVSAFELLTGVPASGKLAEFEGDSEPILQRLRGYEGFEEDLQATFDAAPGGRQWRSGAAKDFLRLLLAADPDHRPTAAEALKHPWLQSYGVSPQATLTSEMMQSLAGYAEASQLTRNCLFALAAKGADECKVEHLCDVFTAVDSDGDGMLSREEFGNALAKAQSWWWSKAPDVELDAAFQAPECSRNFLSYTDFVAICLFSSHVSENGSNLVDANLLKKALEALDHDQDGLLRALDVRLVFGCKVLQRLPRDLTLSLAVVQDALLNGALEDDSLHVPSEVGSSGRAAAQMNSQASGSAFSQLLQSILFAGCGGLPKHVDSYDFEIFEGEALGSPRSCEAAPALAAEIKRPRGSWKPMDFEVDLTDRKDPAAVAMAARAMANGPPDPLLPVPWSAPRPSLEAKLWIHCCQPEMDDTSLGQKAASFSSPSQPLPILLGRRPGRGSFDATSCSSLNSLPLSKSVSMISSPPFKATTSSL